MGDTSIEWTDKTWNPTRGCRRVSPGCQHCYAERVAYRLSGPGQPYEGLVEMGPTGPRWTGKARLVPEHLADPLKWRKPQRIFVDSMSDLFFEGFTFEEIAAVHGVMMVASQHTHQVLTKRPERAAEFDRWLVRQAQAGSSTVRGALLHYAQRFCDHPALRDGRAWDAPDVPWPIANRWLGVSVESAEYKHRIDTLRQVPAALRFLSLEPLLGDLGELDLSGIGWAIVGGESGHGARPMEIEWARSVLEQCRAAGVPCFVKQLGADARTDGTRLHLAGKGGAWLEWPTDLRVREFPA